MVLPIFRAKCVGSTHHALGCIGIFVGRCVDIGLDGDDFPVEVRGPVCRCPDTGKADDLCCPDFGGNANIVAGIIGGDVDKSTVGRDVEESTVTSGDVDDKVIVGGEFNEVIIGGDFDEVIVGGDVDEITAAGRNVDDEVIIGGDVNESNVAGEDVNDEVIIGGDVDEITVGEAADEIVGGRRSRLSSCCK